jgi:hypothetical protein
VLVVLGLVVAAKTSYVISRALIGRLYLVTVVAVLVGNLRDKAEGSN